MKLMREKVGEGIGGSICYLLSWALFSGDVCPPCCGSGSNGVLIREWVSQGCFLHQLLFL